MPFRRRSLFTLAGSTALMVMAACAHAAHYYVSPGGSNSSNGLTSLTAFKTIQKAIDTAAANDTIQVAAGTYRESLDWENKDLTLQGAGAVQSVIDPGVDNGGPGGRCLFVANLSSASAITGFTFQHGALTDLETPGGGIYNVDSSLTMANCIFRDNKIAGMGGGIYSRGSTITPCFPVLVNCLFTGNTAWSGGAISNIVCNTAITNCTITGNTATGTAGSGGGGGIVNGSSHPVITNCILWGDVALQFNQEIVNFKSASATPKHCNIQGLSNTAPDANGNFGANPLFVDPAHGDFRLQSGSPCLESGDDTAFPAGIAADLNGNPRVSRAQLDLGAYEYQNQNPSAGSQSLQLNQDTNLNITLTGSDPEGDAIVYTVASNPTHGSLAGTAPNLTYVPNAGYSGPDSFTFILTDLYGAVSNTATIRISVSSLPTPIEVTGGVSIKASGFTVAGGANYTQTLTITNTGANDIHGPIYLLLDNLGGAGVQLTNLSGTTVRLTPTGRPYIALTNDIPVQGSLKILLKFSNPNRVPITSTPRLYAGSGGM